MKKETEIGWIGTGVILFALWLALFEDSEVSTSDQSERNDNRLPEEKQDLMKSSTDNDIDPYDSFVSTNSPYARKQVKRAYKALDRSSIKLRNVAFSKRLQDRYETTQLTITNTSDVEREVRLWAGNKKPPLSPTLAGDVTDHIFRTITVNSTIGDAIYPQGISVNPFNGYTYIANQLSNNISVLNNEGTLISLIPITVDTSSFGASPVNITPISQSSSPNFGDVYVANIIGDTVSVINNQLEITTTIQVGKRPIAIRYNPFNNYVYVANIGDNTVSVIDSASKLVIETISVGEAPNNIAVANDTGTIYVLNSNDSSISVIDDTLQVINTIENIGSTLSTIAYHPLNNFLYAVASQDNNVIPIDLDTGVIGVGIPVGANPFRIIYNPTNKLLYVGNRDDNTYSLIDVNQTVLDTLSLGSVGTSIAIDPNSDAIYSSDPITGAINIINYSRESNQVIINDEYETRREDFTFNPAIVKHVKFVFSGTERFNVLRLEQETVTGTTKIKPISFSNYNSPQNFGNVAEVFEMNGSIIDGKHGWVFTIAARQTITILTYFEQLEMQDILQENLQTF